MTTETSGRSSARLVGGFAVIFGALTLFSGGQALFSGPAAQAAAGNAVPFVLWFNFLSGFVYVLAGVGIVWQRPWARAVSIGLALAILVVFAMFGRHVLGGGAYEMRTVGAMVLRASVWTGIAIYLIRANGRGGRRT